MASLLMVRTITVIGFGEFLKAKMIPELDLVQNFKTDAVFL